VPTHPFDCAAWKEDNIQKGLAELEFSHPLQGSAAMSCLAPMESPRLGSLDRKITNHRASAQVVREPQPLSLPVITPS